MMHIVVLLVALLLLVSGMWDMLVGLFYLAWGLLAVLWSLVGGLVDGISFRRRRRLLERLGRPGRDG